MIKWFKNILDRTRGVKNETTSLANTALRVGALLEDLARFGIGAFDNTAEYEAGQYAIHNGVLSEVVVNTNAEETPDSHPTKWSKKIVVDPAQITETNHLPVAASAVAKRLIQILGNGNTGGVTPNADEVTKGKVRQSTALEAKQGLVNDAYITPKQLVDALTLFGDTFVEPKLDTVYRRGYVPPQTDLLPNDRIFAGRPEVNGSGALVIGEDGLPIYGAVSLPPTAFNRTLDQIAAQSGAFSHNLTAISGAQYVFLRDPGGQGGMVFGRLINGAFVTEGQIGIFTDGSLGIFHISGSTFRVGDNVFAFAGGSVLAEGYLRANTIGIKSPRRLTSAQYFPAFEFDPVTQAKEVCEISMPGLAAQVQANLDYDALRESLQLSYEQPVSLDGILLTCTDFGGCYEVITTAPGTATPTVYKAKITPSMIGVPQTHGLNAPIEDLLVTFQDKNGNPDTVLYLNFPDNNTYQIDFPEGVGPGYESGKLKIELF
ncbi:hypothetical protein [Spirosoma arcticum]